MAKHVYLVELDGGRSNKDYFQFLKNVQELNAKEPSFGGIQNSCLISHHLDADTLLGLCTFRLKNEKKVSIEEITKETIEDENTLHGIYLDTIQNCFLNYAPEEYVNLQLDEDLDD
ncbi:MAG: hypothetical protein PHO27_02300 [Sulfuricurvum sp.]|nr:hypothetical protein [Sulfuricurvum sp.]